MKKSFMVKYLFLFLTILPLSRRLIFYLIYKIHYTQFLVNVPQIMTLFSIHEDSIFIQQALVRSTHYTPNNFPW